MKRVFLEYQELPLHGVVRFLDQRDDPSHTLDLHDTAVLLPSGRAGRRLMELLVDRCAERGSALVPPLFVAPGSLIETLYLTASTQTPDLLVDRLSWCEALDQLPLEAVQRLAIASSSNDLPFAVRWGLAETLGTLHRELAAQGLSFSQVTERLEGDGFPLSIPDAQREWWRLMSDVSEIRDTVLDRYGLVDRDKARWGVLAAGVLPAFRRLVVACCPDLNAQVQHAITVFPGTVEILIHASAEHAEGFSETGTVRPEVWRSMPINVHYDHLHIASDPRQEALATLDYLSSIAPSCSVSECTLATLTDESRRALHGLLDQHALPYVDAEAPPAALGTLASWLRAATDFAQTGGREEAWRLLRHPHSQGLSPEDRTGLGGMLDTINRSCVQSAIPLHGDPHTFPASAAIEGALSRLLALLAPFREGAVRPLAAWAGPLTELFDGCNLARYIDAGTHRSLDALLALVRDSPSTSPIPGCDALRVLSDGFALVHTPETDSTAALDIVGWLELHLDDAPHLAITGFIENAVPAVLNGDPFLPNTLRRELGLSSNESRMGRDSYLLSALMASRDTHLFLYRHHPDGSQTLPSRLLYRGDTPQKISIAHRFFFDKPIQRRAPTRTPTPPAPELFIPAHRPAMLISSPLQLPVTAISLYLKCPYRFYLRHIEKLQATPQPLCELDSRLFGTVLHNTIQSLGTEQIAGTASHRKLEGRTFRALDVEFERLVGKYPSSAARIQRDAARLRLADFVRWQIAAAEEGWQPLHSEYSLDPTHTTIKRGDITFILVGRIDRIEQNRFTGGLRIIDFKTGKHVPTAWTQTAGWKDPQLPLYALLLTRHPAFAHLAPETIELCYLPLDGSPPIEPRTPRLPPEEFDAVAALLEETLTHIAEGLFWPPSPQSPNDDYAALIGSVDSISTNDEL